MVQYSTSDAVMSVVKIRVDEGLRPAGERVRLLHEGFLDVLVVVEHHRPGRHEDAEHRPVRLAQLVQRSQLKEVSKAPSRE